MWRHIKSFNLGDDVLLVSDWLSNLPLYVACQEECSWDILIHRHLNNFLPIFDCHFRPVGRIKTNFDPINPPEMHYFGASTQHIFIIRRYQLHIHLRKLFFAL